MWPVRAGLYSTVIYGRYEAEADYILGIHGMRRRGVCGFTTTGSWWASLRAGRPAAAPGRPPREATIRAYHKQTRDGTFQDVNSAVPASGRSVCGAAGPSRWGDYTITDLGAFFLERTCSVHHLRGPRTLCFTITATRPPFRTVHGAPRRDYEPVRVFRYGNRLHGIDFL